MNEIENSVQHGLFAMGDLNVAFQQYFTGNSYHNALVKDDQVNVTVSNVSFAPGARNNWHIHHDGYQILLVTGGEGWYQEAGKPAQRLHPGDVVVTPDGVKHWHGATKNSWFSHIAITAGTPEWLEPVSDSEYQALE